MSTVQEIEEAIDTLAPAQMEQLYLWLDEKYQKLVDDSLQADIAAGRFDQAIDRALADKAAGRLTPL